MKKVCMMLIMLFMAGSSVELQAQNEDTRTERMQKMTKQRVEALAKELKLDKEKTASFVTLCTEYYTKLMELRMAKPVDNSKRTEGKMTDEKAEEFITKTFDLEQKEVELKKEYYAKMKKEFTASQLLCVFAQQRRVRSMPNNGQRQQRPGFGRNNGNFNGGGGFGGDF